MFLTKLVGHTKREIIGSRGIQKLQYALIQCNFVLFSLCISFNCDVSTISTNLTFLDSIIIIIICCRLKDGLSDIIKTLIILINNVI